IRIPVDKIRDVIGPGGKMIRSIIERTGVKIDVEDDGRVNVASADGESAQKAINIIQELTATPELNKSYMGKVQRITDFGAFVEIMPGTDGLLHVSEIANYLVKVTIQSEDFAYSFAVDEYRIIRRVPAGGTTTFEFRADRAGTFRFYSNLTNDRAHADMQGRLIVRPK